MDEELDLIPISALAQYTYCPRRAALILLERQWADNLYTAEGRQVHNIAHQSNLKQRLPDGYSVRGLFLRSDRLGLVGMTDVVEFHENPPEPPQVVVVEFKRGRHKKGSQLEYHVQLCAQVICLEEMLQMEIHKASLFFAKSQRRLDVACDQALRTMVETTVTKVREMIDSRQTPRAKYGPKCRSCSLIELCLPRATCPRDFQRILHGLIEESAPK